MKNTIMLLILLVMAGVVPTRAQTFNELFRQKKTQEKCLLRQIAALQGYIQILHTGYRQVQEGLQFIGQLQTASGRLHQGWFERLLKHPGDPESAAAFTLLQRLQQQAEGLLAKGPTAHLSPPQWAAFMRYVLHLIKESKKDAGELWLLAGDGTLRLASGERMQLIHGVYQQVKARYGRFYRSIRHLQHFSAAQARHQLALSVLKKMYAKPGS